MVLPYINMNQPQVYTCSPSRTPLPPPSPYHPSGSSHCTSHKQPVSCIELGLAIHFIYDIIHVSMPFSQIIPPSPSNTDSKRLFYTSVSFNFMAAITICSDFGAPKNKVSHCFHCFPIYLSCSNGTGCHGLSFLNVEFKTSFVTLLFQFHQEAL